MVQDGFDPLETLESLEIRYNHHKQCHKAIKTPESISELKNWRTQRLSDSAIYLEEADSATLGVCDPPKSGMRFMTPFIGYTVKIRI
jgi:hypothetical protein